MSLNTISIVAAEHPVKSVVVLKSSKAEVVRKFDVILKAGQNKLIISKLPSTIDTKSVRISGLNTGSTKNKTYLSDVVCSVSDGSDDALNETIHALEVRKAALENEKLIFGKQAEILVKYANSLTGEHANPSVMTGFLNVFAERGKENIQVVAELDAQIKEIDKTIKHEKKQISLLKGSANTELTVVITSEHNTLVDLKLTYIVNKTSWSPTYELHAITDDNGQPSRTVTLHYRACITQSTGEDWTDADLVLSTVATDTIVKRIPKLEPIKIRVESTYGRERERNNPLQKGPQLQVQQTLQVQQVQQPHTLFGQRHTTFGPGNVPGISPFGNTTGGGALFGGGNQTRFGFGNTAGGNTNVFGGTNTGGSQTGLGTFGTTAPPVPTLPPPPPPPPPGAPAPALDDDFVAIPDGSTSEGEDGDTEAPATVVTQTPMALTYAVRGKSSIPSDGKEHIVTVVILSFETAVEYVSVPRVDPRVYLQCQVKNNSEYRLLPGPVSVILDDSYVSKTTISDVNRNDTFNFTLGDDPSVHISYSRLSKSVKEGSGTFADVVNITTYTTSIAVQNKHRFPIEKLLLKDAVPMSEDKRVRVVLRKPKELVEAKEGVYVKVRKEKSGDNKDGEMDGDDGLRVKWEKEKDGLYEYQWRVDADAKVKLETVFEMKASVDLTCSFVENNLLGKRAD